jgi:retinol dehydrogenase-12
MGDQVSSSFTCTPIPYSDPHHSLQVNHLGTSLISLLLLPIMIKTGETFGTHPRLTIVTSVAHYDAVFPPELLASPNVLQTMSSKEYCTSK